MHSTDSKIWRRALAVAGISAAAALLAGCSLLGQVNELVGGGTDTGGESDGGAGSGSDDVFSIRVGDCFNDDTTEGETVSTVEKVDCSVEHTWEAYESVLMTDAEYPGDAETQDRAQAECLAAFEPYVGIDYDNSTLDLSYYYPTEETWAELRDREILCLLIDPEGSTTGSLQGAAR